MLERSAVCEGTTGPRLALEVVRRRRAALTAGFLLAIAGACSSSGSRPSVIGSCVPDAGTICTAPGGSGGGGGSNDGGCGGYSTATACEACAVADCCTELGNCNGSTDCDNLYSCETSCEDTTGATACITACENQYPTAVGTLNVLLDCLSTRCTACEESGIGDPCEPPYPPCATGLTCSNGGWCATPTGCTASTQCAGAGAGGLNQNGGTNSCMILPNGSYSCVPGCAQSSTACSYFSGYYCRIGVATADQPAQTVDVCWPLPDAAVGD